MTDEDRRRWDERYESRRPPPVDAVGLPSVFAAYADLFPTGGRGLDLACGQGFGAVWLANRGMTMLGLDISATAIEHARDLARRSRVGQRCRFDVCDLDEGLPDGPPVDVVLCHMFRDRRLDRAIIDRLAPGGLLAMVALSEIGAAPGPFRVTPGELTNAFTELDAIANGEGMGQAWLLARA